jgi:predicted O-methyltransferase YrrM
MMNIPELLRAAPRLHNEGTRSYQVSTDVLRFLDRHVQPGHRTLEIGAGVSTVAFAIKGAVHVAVTPHKDEAERIEQFCRTQGIPLTGLRFELGPSDQRLPRLTETDLDLVLIDGAHGFPMPFLDWHYTADRLKIGGLCIIDDTHLWTGHILKQYLKQEPEWQLETDFAPRSVVFRKYAQRDMGKNELQPYVVEETVRLVFDLYPAHVETLRTWTPSELWAAKARGWRYRAWRVRRFARTCLVRVLPEPIKAGLRAILR